MIQIEDYDMPITVAEKLVLGTGDMFDLEEIKEIADYLMVYYQAHQNGD